VNKQIDKQLKKDKKKYKSTHRLQLVGPAGSGKSTLITQVSIKLFQWHAENYKRSSMTWCAERHFPNFKPLFYFELKIVLFQMRLLHENETVTDEVRLSRKRDILVVVRDALELVIATMDEFDLAVSAGENELHRKERERERE
jgi:DNA polymerase III delta prime subunit